MTAPSSLTSSLALLTHCTAFAFMNTNAQQELKESYDTLHAVALRFSQVGPMAAGELQCSKGQHFEIQDIYMHNEVEDIGEN